MRTKLIEPTELLGKYVYYTESYSKNGIIIQPKAHLFVIFDKISDCDDPFRWCIESVWIKKFQLWVKRTQLIVLDEQMQESIKILYGKS